MWTPLQGRRGRWIRVAVLAIALMVGGGVTAALALLPSDLRSEEREGPTTPVAATAPVMPAPSGPGLRTALAAALAETADDATTAERPSTSTPPAAKADRPGKAYYRKTVARKVPKDAGSSFMPLYKEAAETFGVSWQLLASVHRQETAFSSVKGVYEGLNAFGCCAGPMQFNLTNGPPSTWDLYKGAFRKGTRPAAYPHSTKKHPSPYDDFDAIMAAGALLADSGANAKLEGPSWGAAYAYYGRDLFGITYASQVLGRARGWATKGFCPDCADDPSLVAAYDDAFGVDARRTLLAAKAAAGGDDAEKRKKAKARAKRKKAAAAKRAAARRKAAREAGSGPAPAKQRPKATAEQPAAEPKPAAEPDKPAKAPPKAEPAPTGPTSPSGEGAPAPAPAAPGPAGSCSGLDQLAGCG